MKYYIPYRRFKYQPFYLIIILQKIKSGFIKINLLFKRRSHDNFIAVITFNIGGVRPWNFCFLYIFTLNFLINN